MAKIRCDWCLGDTLYENYHDFEWGVPVKEDRKLFELLVLESFQAGLSWITILRKRENFRQAFDDFDYHKVARYQAAKVSELLDNPGIVRHRAKIEAAINNANAFIKIRVKFGSFSNFIWSYVDHKPILNDFESLAEVPAQTPLSREICNDLKQRGFVFFGPTTVYAFMQTAGLVNDHVAACYKHKKSAGA